MSGTSIRSRSFLLCGALILLTGLLSACSTSSGGNEVQGKLEGRNPQFDAQPAKNQSPPGEGPQGTAAETPGVSAGAGETGQGTKPGSATVGPKQPVTSAFPYTAHTLASGLNVPWEMAFAPDGRIFFTERPGSLRVIENGKLRSTPLLELKAPFVSRGEGGLLGLALDPAFKSNGLAYVYHSYRSKEGGVANRVLQIKIGSSTAAINKVLMDNIPGDTNHNGGRIKIGPDGYLYITTGERYEPDLAQDRNSLGGKILRITTSGAIPKDNPRPGSPIYSMGHRNPQGLAWQPGTGVLYSSEHGQSSHDEINIIQAGANYGWPLIEGDETGAARLKLAAPLVHSGEETWAPSGMTFITQGPWKGELLVAGLAGEQLLRVSLSSSGGTPVVTGLFQEEYGRIRNVAEGPDGTLYLMTNNRDGRGSPRAGDDKLIALHPNWK
ncbi:PQQ-dependent sugar dehydrogenase [Paenibacillus sp. MMS20-IR301]|uniref:PQQ-dependent sugar dehydrogenase n=1 Tax=Paenibacillus sp. MMS20-IR301 TaxID=2895946 RepID=UPI0028E28B41|nr:PQQ-dependent sugar dehydrogenase [Paenibacillus sp. MMS20-IR301]WNS40978.1 PQQ-dependent sugar dehydrogenase [Paenibacillus sp. MMS20-IR301]